MNMGTMTVGDMIFLLVSSPILLYFFRMIIEHTFSKAPPLPPGPYPWPIIGNLFQIGKTNIHIRLAEMAQEHGPLMSLRLGQRTAIVGSSSAAASEILKTHDHVLSGRDVPHLLKRKESIVHNRNLVFSAECNDDWRIIRSMYRSKIFSNKALESRAEMKENKVSELVKYLGSKEGEVIIIKDVLFVTAMNILSNAVLSIDLVDFEGNGIGSGVMESIRKLAMLGAKQSLQDMFPIFGQWDLQGWYKQVKHIIEHELGDVWKDSLGKKRSGSNISSSLKDFTDVLIEKGYTNQQINPLMQELFSAGTETTSLTIEWLMAELLKNKVALQKATDEVMNQIDGNVVKDSDLVNLPFLEACFKETLRLHPPGPLLLPHKAIQTCEMMGYTIPKDSQILVNVWAISHDPNIWDDPFSFKPERFIGSKVTYKGNDFEFLPFGSGRRMCPGETMGTKTVLLTAATLILNFEWFLPNNMNPNEMNMEEELGVSLHKKEPLNVILKLREKYF